MARRKRPLSSEFEEASLGSTDALCRAVKRLHTYSAGTSSYNTSTKDVGGGNGTAADQEVSSALGRTDELAAPLAVPEDRQQAGDAPQRRPLMAENRLTAARASLKVPDKGQQAAKPDGNAGKDTTTAPAAALKPPLEPKGADRQPSAGLQLDLDRLRHRLEHVAVSGGNQEADAVPQPSTPVRREASSPAGSKGHRLGTRDASDPDSLAYALMYEEANNLLKNLHFARLQRHAKTGSDS